MTRAAFTIKHGHDAAGCCALGLCGREAFEDARQVENAKCSSCGDEITDGTSGLCFTCCELENNRRYRLHHSIGEYAKENS